MTESMKGVVFTELLDWLEQNHGVVGLDEILLDAELPNGGAYTSTGTYQWSELASILRAASDYIGEDVPSLMRRFGRHLFAAFARNYADLLNGATDAFECLAQVESYIHPEVRKLHPDADLPRFDIDTRESGITMEYESPRATGELARGMIEGCLEHFGAAATIVQSSSGSRHRFVVAHQEAGCPATR